MQRRGFVLAGLATVLVATKANALSVYVVQDGQVLGPFDEAGLRAHLGSRAKAAVTLVWMQGMAEWLPASQVPELAVLVARLPLDPPFDAAKFLTGSWLSDDHPIKVGNSAFVGQMSFVFADDGTFSQLATGTRTTVTVKPGPKPREPEVDSEFLYLNSSTKGNFTVVMKADGYFGVSLKGTNTNNSSGSTGETQDWQGSLDFRRLGPDQMQTRFGVRYRRTAG